MPPPPRTSAAPVHSPCCGKIWSQELSPPHQHLSWPREGCPAHPLGLILWIPFPHLEYPSPAPPVRMHAGLQDPHPILPPPGSLACLLPRNIIPLCSDLRELRLTGDGSALRSGAPWGPQPWPAFREPPPGPSGAQSCPDPPGLMLEEGTRPTGGPVHTQQGGKLPAGLTWRKSTPVSVQ